VYWYLIHLAPGNFSQYYLCFFNSSKSSMFLTYYVIYKKKKELRKNGFYDISRLIHRQDWYIDLKIYIINKIIFNIIKYILIRDPCNRLYCVSDAIKTSVGTSLLSLLKNLWTKLKSLVITGYRRIINTIIIIYFLQLV